MGALKAIAGQDTLIMTRFAEGFLKGAICKNASFFSSHRMIRRYVTEAYIR